VGGVFVVAPEKGDPGGSDAALDDIGPYPAVGVKERTLTVSVQDRERGRRGFVVGVGQ
jgi:hypothetical protein